MSDRTLLIAATVPILCSGIALAFLQRMPAFRLPEAHAAVAKGTGSLGANVASSRKVWVGVVVAGYTAELAADAEGRVAQVFARTGARVAAGDKLLQFDESQASTAFGMAGAELEQRRSELSRAQARADAAKSKLVRMHAGEQWLSQQEVETAEAEASVANAELRAARAAVGVGQAQWKQQWLVMDRRTLVAPFAGTVVSLNVDPGASVAAGQVVMRVLSDDRQIRFAFPPGELSPSENARVLVKLVGSKSSIEAPVSALRPELDPSADLVFGTAMLPSDLPDVANWLPGAQVEVSRLSPASSVAP